jgi:MFS family permease
VYPVALVESAITQFFNPAKSALIPSLVDRRQLILANSLSSLGSDLVSLVGPALGGVLLGMLGLTSVVLLDSASFLISGITIFLILVPHNLPDGQVETSHSTNLVTWMAVWQDWLTGLEQIKSERLIITLFTAMGVAMLGQGILSVLWVAFVKEILKGNALEYGWVQVAVAAGGVVGGLLIGHAGKILSSGRLIAFGGMAIGLLLLATFNIPSLLMILALQVLVGISAIGFFVTIRTLLQTSVADKYLGRTFGTFGTTNALLMLGGQGLASALGDRVGIVPMLNISAILYFLGGTVALIIPSTVDCLNQLDE